MVWNVIRRSKMSMIKIVWLVNLLVWGDELIFCKIKLVSF